MVTPYRPSPNLHKASPPSRVNAADLGDVQITELPAAEDGAQPKPVGRPLSSGRTAALNPRVPPET